LQSRINFNNATNLSHTFIERIGETYANGYAQKNVFSLKKDNDFDESGDGYLYVPNVNLQDKKTIAQYMDGAKKGLTVTGFKRLALS
jgi:hypothetical protein